VQDQRIWTWKDREECILVRELKAIRMVLMGTLGERVKKEGISLLRLCVDNSSVVHVTNAFVASSKPMMRELRRLKKVLDELGLQLSSEWISSVVLCAAKDETSVDIMGRMFCFNFLRKGNYDKSG
jgi:hypothetical protein